MSGMILDTKAKTENVPPSPRRLTDSLLVRRESSRQLEKMGERLATLTEQLKSGINLDIKPKTTESAPTSPQVRRESGRQIEKMGERLATLTEQNRSLREERDALEQLVLGLSQFVSQPQGAGAPNPPTERELALQETIQLLEVQVDALQEERHMFLRKIEVLEHQLAEAKASGDAKDCKLQVFEALFSLMDEKQREAPAKVMELPPTVDPKDMETVISTLTAECKEAHPLNYSCHPVKDIDAEIEVLNSILMSTIDDIRICVPDAESFK